MQIIALILALAAVVLFSVHAIRFKDWIAGGLALLAASWVVQAVILTGDHITMK